MLLPTKTLCLVCIVITHNILYCAFSLCLCYHHHHSKIYNTPYRGSRWLSTDYRRIYYCQQKTLCRGALYIVHSHSGYAIIITIQKNIIPPIEVVGGSLPTTVVYTTANKNTVPGALYIVHSHSEHVVGFYLVKLFPIETVGGSHLLGYSTTYASIHP